MSAVRPVQKGNSLTPTFPTIARLAVTSVLLVQIVELTALEETVLLGSTFIITHASPLASLELIPILPPGNVSPATLPVLPVSITCRLHATAVS